MNIQNGRLRIPTPAGIARSQASAETACQRSGRVRRGLFETGKASSGVGWLSNGCSSTPSFPDAGQTVAAAFVIISQIAGCKECQAYILLLLWIGRTNRLVGADGTKSEGRGP